ncbi:MAG: hypothetical protein ACRD4A_04890, partial [Candidatus Acidiferrales bacterium]
MSPEYDNPKSHALAAEASAAEGTGAIRVATPAQVVEEPGAGSPEAAETSFPTDNAGILAENPEYPGEQAREEAGQKLQQESPETNQQAIDKAVDTPMEQLIDQYAAPQPVSAGGEIFDGRVIAVTDLGVV